MSSQEQVVRRVQELDNQISRLKEEVRTTQMHSPPVSTPQISAPITRIADLTYERNALIKKATK